MQKIKISVLCISLMVINCLAQKKELHKEAFLSYKWYDNVYIGDIYKMFKSLEDLEREFRGDTIQKAKKDTVPITEAEMKKKLLGIKEKYSKKHPNNLILGSIDKAIKNMSDVKSDQENLDASETFYNYYFFQDTVRINQPILIGDRVLKTVFIPKHFKKYREATYNGKTHRDILNYKEIYKRKNTNYEIKIDKNDTKEILNIKGYKIIITEKSNLFTDSQIHNVYELYVSDQYQYPLGYYDFLELKKYMDIKGLILECKVFDANSPKTYSLLQLTDFNTKKQDHSLIEIDLEKYKKEEF